jgi:hypothetical protein
MDPDGGFISTGIDFLMDGGLTVAYWCGELDPKRSGGDQLEEISRKRSHNGAVHVEFGAEDHGERILHQQYEYRDVHDA